MSRLTVVILTLNEAHHIEANELGPPATAGPFLTQRKPAQRDVIRMT